MTRSLCLLSALLLFACETTRSAEATTTPTAPSAPAAAPAPPAASDPCTLPIETQPCDKPAPRFAFDASAKACVQLPAGQCPTNANDFIGPLHCMKSCLMSDAMREAGDGWARGHKVWGCKVDNKVYALGTGGFKIPGDCNTCTCGEGGHLQCTRIGCPGTMCPEGTQIGRSCAYPGDADGCVVLETACLDICKTNDDCATTARHRCIEGLCRSSFP